MGRVSREVTCVCLLRQGGAAPSVPSASKAMLQEPPFARDLQEGPAAQPPHLAAQPPLPAQPPALPSAHPPAQTAGVVPSQPTALLAPMALPATAAAVGGRVSGPQLPPVDRQRSGSPGTHSVTLAEYFARRKGMIHPDDCFRIFCQVRNHLAAAATPTGVWSCWLPLASQELCERLAEGGTPSHLFHQLECSCKMRLRSVNLQYG